MSDSKDIVVANLENKRQLESSRRIIIDHMDLENEGLLEDVQVNNLNGFQQPTSSNIYHDTIQDTANLPLYPIQHHRIQQIANKYSLKRQ